MRRPDGDTAKITEIDVHGSGWRHPDRGGCGTTPVERRANRGSNRLIRVLQIPQALLPARAIKQRRIHMYIAGAETADGFHSRLVWTSRTFPLPLTRSVPSSIHCSFTPLFLHCILHCIFTSPELNELIDTSTTNSNLEQTPPSVESPKVTGPAQQHP